MLVGVLLFGGNGNAEKPDDPAVVEPDPAPTTPLTLDQTTLNLNQAETATLTVTGAEDVLWTSSDTNVATVDDTGLVTAAYKGDNGCAVQVTPAGFNGAVTMMVGVDNDGKVTGISIISHTETAGLGATAAADTDAGRAFRDQFIGMSGTVSVTKDGGEVDALTGATITSRAVCTGVSAALACAANLG